MPEPNRNDVTIEEALEIVRAEGMRRKRALQLLLSQACKREDWNEPSTRALMSCLHKTIHAIKSLERFHGELLPAPRHDK